MTASTQHAKDRSSRIFDNFITETELAEEFDLNLNVRAMYAKTYLFVFQIRPSRLLFLPHHLHNHPPHLPYLAYPGWT